MSEETTLLQSETDGEATTHMVHAVMRFFMAVRYRKSVVITALGVTALLGGLYYVTATEYYAAHAQVMVIYSGNDSSPSSVPSDGTRPQTLMPTFESLFTSTRVIERALEQLDQPDDLIDLEGVPRAAWAEVLKKNLTSQALRSKHIVQISYRSKNPKTAVRVVNAIVVACEEFLEETHRGNAAEIRDILGGEIKSLEEDLAECLRERKQLSLEAGTMGISSDSTIVHPKLQRAITSNDMLMAAQRQRAELEASLATIWSAVQNGENLQPHVMTVANVVGEELLLRTLGFNQRDAVVQANLERKLLEDRASLENMYKQGLGPSHPWVGAKVNEIRMTEQHLIDYQQRINARLAEIQNHQLGPVLLSTVQQKLAETREREKNFAVQYEQAQVEANAHAMKVDDLTAVELRFRRLQDRNATLDTRIREIRVDGADVRTKVTEPPVLAKNPVSPSLKRLLVMVLAGGLVIGLGLVYVLDILDDRFRGADEMHAQLGVPVLAMVRQLETSESTGPEALRVHVDPNGAECEAFRTLRTALALADREARRIVISSAEPGDGKTTVLANLAVSYAQSDKRTLLIDADLRRPGLTTLMDMRGVDGLSGVIRGSDDVVGMATAHIRSSGIDGLDVLSSGPRPTNPAELLANPRFSELLAWAETVYDQILIDSPPALATSDACVVGRLVDGVVMVVQPDKNRRRQVIRAAESFAALKIPLLGIVVNRVGSDNAPGYYGYGGGYGYGYDYTEEEREGGTRIDDHAASAAEVEEPAVFSVRQVVRESDESQPAVAPRRVA